MNTARELAAKLASSDPIERMYAREMLVDRGGKDVTGAVIKELADPRRYVRWEAARVLLDLADPDSAPELIDAMADDDPDVRWLAAEAVAGLGKTGVDAVLNGLTRDDLTLDFCKAAHHALSNFHKVDDFKELVEPVIQALNTSTPEVSAPVVAFHALELLHPNGKKCSPS